MALTVLKGTIVSAPALGKLEITEGGYLVAEDVKFEVRDTGEIRSSTPGRRWRISVTRWSSSLWRIYTSMPPSIP